MDYKEVGREKLRRGVVLFPRISISFQPSLDCGLANIEIGVELIFVNRPN